MEVLTHTETVTAHAFAFSDEAFDLGLIELAEELKMVGETLSSQIEQILQTKEDIGALQKKRQDAQAELERFYQAMTHHMTHALNAERVDVLCPGRYLGVLERMRFRRRRLKDWADRDPKLFSLFQAHTRAIAHFDQATDTYLLAQGKMRASTERLIREGQRARMGLEEAKSLLLLKVSLGDPALKRIRARVVRTRRPVWTLDPKERLTQEAEPLSDSKWLKAS